MTTLKLIACLVSFSLCVWTSAQVNDHALGLRGELGDHENRGEISYQLGFSDITRLELDLGYTRQNAADQITTAGIYHWVLNLFGGFNAFIGPGARLGYYLPGNPELEGFTADAGGQLGVEYDFSYNGPPLMLSFDARPMFRFIGDGKRGFTYGGAFAIRITF
ncbi:MAG: hypothetical protein EP338_10345 [Bacteroidetes bacterium]|nr:MAG: hypothetical protein EP338_10345 [Bacteroidota bacterium]